MVADDLSAAVWRRSSHSGGDNGSQCVEVALSAGWAGLRDSKQRAAGPAGAPVLAVPLPSLRAFLTAARQDDWQR